MNRKYKRNALPGVGVVIAGSEERDEATFDELPGHGYQGGEPGDEVEGVEDQLLRAVAPSAAQEPVAARGNAPSCISKMLT